MKQYLPLFLSQAGLYLFITLNYIAISQLNYVGTALTDGMIATLNFFLIKKIAKSEDETWRPWLAYTLGGIVGSLLGIALHK